MIKNPAILSLKRLFGLGRWRVRYPDGQRSMPMSYRIAVGYAAIFGGDVVPTDKPILHLGLR